MSSIAYNPIRTHELVVGCASGAVECYDTGMTARHCSSDKRVPERRLLMTRVKAHRKEVRGIAFHPFAAQCVTVSADVTFLWDSLEWVKRRALGSTEAPVKRARACAMAYRLQRLFFCVHHPMSL